MLFTALIALTAMVCGMVLGSRKPRRRLQETIELLQRENGILQRKLLKAQKHNKTVIRWHQTMREHYHSRRRRLQAWLREFVQPLSMLASELDVDLAEEARIARGIEDPTKRKIEKEAGDAES
jgi:hypothetical protein